VKESTDKHYIASSLCSQMARSVHILLASKDYKQLQVHMSEKEYAQVELQVDRCT
jgi:hypothetical protein